MFYDLRYYRITYRYISYIFHVRIKLLVTAKSDRDPNPALIWLPGSGSALRYLPNLDPNLHCLQHRAYLGQPAARQADQRVRWSGAHSRAPAAETDRILFLPPSFYLSSSFSVWWIRIHMYPHWYGSPGSGSTILGIQIQSQAQENWSKFTNKPDFQPFKKACVTT